MTLPPMVLLPVLSPSVSALPWRSTVVPVMVSSELTATAPDNFNVRVPVTLGDSV